MSIKEPQRHKLSTALTYAGSAFATEDGDEIGAGADERSVYIASHHSAVQLSPKDAIHFAFTVIEAAGHTLGGGQ